MFFRLMDDLTIGTLKLTVSSLLHRPTCSNTLKTRSNVAELYTHGYEGAIRWTLEISLVTQAAQTNLSKQPPN